MATALHDADAAAGQRLLATRPVWTGLTRAGEMTQTRRILFHAGPPFRGWDQVPVPVRNSLALACIYEGWADTTDDAMALLRAGTVACAPAQDHDLVVPLAGVISPSMMLHRITDAASGRVKYAALNEGMEHCLRAGALDEEIPRFHRWLNGPYSEWLATRLDRPVALLPVLRESLARGDDGHSRTLAASALFADLLVDDRTPPEMAGFQLGCHAFALNLWMGAAALILGAADGVEDSCLVTRAGGNGIEFGIQLAAAPGRWRTVTAAPPAGPVEPAHQAHGAVGAIGDSAVVDVLGLGGQSVGDAPAVREGLGAYLPADATRRPHMLLPLWLEEAGGLRTGLSARSVTDRRLAPLVLLGIISDTGRGRIGGGVYEPPVSLFGDERATPLR